MYCSGTCQYLNERKHKCELTGEKTKLHEAIKKLSYDDTAYGGACTEEVRKTAIKALEEVQRYREIGTPEECLRNKDFLDFLSDKMNPNDFEIYLQIYNSQDVKGGGVDGN